ARIRRIFLDGYDILVFRIAIFKISLFKLQNDPEREFRSSRKHFKTLSLDESRSPNFDLFSDQEEYSKEDVADIMAETIKQYMIKTRADYGLGVARPKWPISKGASRKHIQRFES
ncbi:hypothetical protein Tco_1559668, partial [Tanacetum coccineum]